MKTLSDSLSKTLKKHKAFKKKAPSEIGKTAFDLFNKNFKNQGFFSSNWKPAKNGNDKVLTGAKDQLRKSLKLKVAFSDARIYSKKQYAFAHNYGYTGLQNVPSTRVKKSVLATGVSRKAFNRKSYSRKVSLQKRQFVGNHHLLIKKINFKLQILFKRYF